MLEFRALKPEEIEIRVGTVHKDKVSLLLYKDARADQAILDETVGCLNWQRSHSRDNANCTVSIWDSEKQMWVSKEDTGTESNTEREKGLASDSFKRACTNWGIGRELYTAPRIFVKAETEPLGNNKHKLKKAYSLSDLIVSKITIKDKRITDLVIVDKFGNQIYKMGAKSEPIKNNAPSEPTITRDQVKELAGMVNDKLTVEVIQKIIEQYGYKKVNDIKDSQFLDIKNIFELTAKGE